MAKIRYTDKDYLRSKFVLSLPTRDHVYFYQQLFISHFAQPCGVYRFTVHEFAFYMKFTVQEVEDLLQYFIDKKKIVIKDDEIAILYYLEWNLVNGMGKPTKDAIISSAKHVRNKELLFQVIENSPTHEIRETLKGLIINSFPDIDVTLASRGREVQRDGERDVPPDVKRDVSATSDVTPTIYNSIYKVSNYNTGAEKNGNGGNDPEDPDSGKGPEKKIDAPPPPGLSLHQKSIQANGSSPICLSFYLDGTTLSKNILELLNTASEWLLMAGDLYKRPLEFQKFVIEHFVREALSKGEERSPGKLRVDFMWMVTNRIGELERAFQKELQDLAWFETELNKCMNGTKPNIIQSYRDFYLTPLASGSHYYQTLANFSVEKSFTKWREQEHKTYDKIKRKASSSGAAIIPKDGMTLEQLQDHYLN